MSTIAVRLRPERVRNQEGYVLFAALMAMVIVSFVVMALLSMTSVTSRASSTFVEESRRNRVADSALDLAMVRVARNATADRHNADAAARPDAMMGKLGQPCGPFTFEIDNRIATVTCTGLAVPANEEVMVGGSPRPATSPGLLRRVELHVGVGDSSGAGTITKATAIVRIIDMVDTGNVAATSNAPGTPANGVRIIVENRTLCNQPRVYSGTPISDCVAAP